MHLTLIVPAPFETVSGGFAYDRHIVAGLRAAGHRVSVVAIPGAHPLADNAAQDAACLAWEALPDGTRPLIDGLALPAFAGMDDALAARGTMALVHHPTALETGYSEDDSARLHGIESRLLPRLSRVITTSDQTAEQLHTEFGVPRARVAVVMPGTDDAPRSDGSGGTCCQILSIGALVPRKGHDVLLRALARLSDLDWQLTIVGTSSRDPVCASGLVALGAKLGMARRVCFAGEVDDGTLATLWRNTDLFALASHREGYGMAIAEALKRGVPVAVTAVGIVPTLVTPENGVVVQPGDSNMLSKALRRVIFGAGMRREMAEAAWQTGRNLPSWDEQSRAFAAALLSTD